MSLLLAKKRAREAGVDVEEVSRNMAVFTRRVAETNKRRRVGPGTWACIHPQMIHVGSETLKSLGKTKRLDVAMRLSPAVFRVCAEDAWIE